MSSSESDFSDTEDTAPPVIVTNSIEEDSESSLDHANEGNASPKQGTKSSVIEGLMSDLDTLCTEINTVNKSFGDAKKEHDQKFKELNTEMKRVTKQYSMLLKKLNKEIHSLVKRPRKKKSGEPSGLMKLQPVPAKLRKYLGLEDEPLARPTIHKLLNAKFKENGFKNGKITVINKKKDAKALSVQQGYTIEFHEMQTFIKKFYDEVKQPIASTN
uniref:DM2 domain-containing protein n=1 Tax=Megaviridae environmental sample TaxID=1737588 RepID=A0A5J6VKH4_9VIRU|nr:MAG: hypothetical protein [Megaviridae environmental sample]